MTIYERAADLIAGLFHGDLDALDPIGLAAAHAEQAAVLGDGDGVALHVLHAAPGKLQVLELLWRGLLLRDDLEIDAFGTQVVGTLYQPAAADLPETAATRLTGRWPPQARLCPGSATDPAY